MRAISPQPHGHRMLSGSITRSTRGKSSGSQPRLRFAAGAERDRACVASASATAVS